jgi:hypothetical protein
VRAATTDLAIESVVAEAQILSEYPKWRALKPKGAPTLELVLDARYLADLAAAAVKFQKGSPTPFIRIRAWNEPKRRSTWRPVAILKGNVEGVRNAVPRQ